MKIGANVKSNCNFLNRSSSYWAIYPHSEGLPLFPIASPQKELFQLHLPILKATGNPELSKLHLVSSPQKENTSGDVVFVHGLGGHHLDTWRIASNTDAYWPAWLDSALPSITVYSAEYEASPSRWLGHAMPISDQALNLLARFEADGIGKRPLVFVTHSLGGLLIKQMLRNADGFGTPAWKGIVSHTRGVIFLATPHHGSRIAVYLGALRNIFRQTEIASELETNAAPLRELNLWYRENVSRLNIRTQIFYETRDTRGIRVVDESSSDPGIMGVIPTPIDADHLGVCKPKDRSEWPAPGLVDTRLS